MNCQKTREATSTRAVERVRAVDSLWCPHGLCGVPPHAQVSRNLPAILPVNRGSHFDTRNVLFAPQRFKLPGALLGPPGRECDDSHMHRGDGSQSVPRLRRSPHGKGNPGKADVRGRCQLGAGRLVWAPGSLLSDFQVRTYRERLPGSRAFEVSCVWVVRCLYFRVPIPCHPPVECTKGPIPCSTSPTKLRQIARAI